MKEGLNLLPSVAKFQAAKIKLKKGIGLGMGFFVGLWILLLLAVFGWLFFNNYSLKKAQSANSLVSNKYKTLATSVVLSKKNKYQAKIVGQVLNERFEYGTLIQEVTNLFSENVTLGDYQIKDKKQFLLKGNLVNGSNMDEIENKIKEINSGKYPDFSSAKLKTIMVTSTGWSFEMEVSFT
jgi:hypothetical protein